jgi:DNA polymerase V
MKAIDKVNAKSGTRIIRLGTTDAKTWNMKQNMLSPRYTTDLKDIMVVQCR